MRVAEPCATCGALLHDGYYLLAGQQERYCGSCIAVRPRCASCTAPLGDAHWQLHDGRRLCARCHRTAVLDGAEAQRLYDETVHAVVASLGLHVAQQPTFRLLDRPTLERLRDDEVIPDSRQLLGLYVRRGDSRGIYLLHGLPRLLFRITVAHEYAHAWQDEHCPRLGEELREGAAEWVAYRSLLHLGSIKAAARMREGSHPYRPALERVLAIEQRLGTAGLLAWLSRPAA